MLRAKWRVQQRQAYIAAKLHMRMIAATTATTSGPGGLRCKYDGEKANLRGSSLRTFKDSDVHL